MDGLGEKKAYRLSSALDVNGRFVLIKGPYYFVIVFTFWLLLILYTLKRQFQCYKRRRQIFHIKKLQLEIRKKLKREQLTFDLARNILHASMVKTGLTSIRKIAQLTNLHTLLQDINNQLEKLHSALDLN